MSSEFYIREVLGRQRPWGVLAWDVAGQAIVYMCLQAVGYLALVSVRFWGGGRGAFISQQCPVFAIDIMRDEYV